jgi:SET domain-containing protein
MVMTRRRSADAARTHRAHRDVPRARVPRDALGVVRPSTPHAGVYARIGRSRIHGIGVIAIRDIPKGTFVFRGESERVRWVSRAAVRRLPAAIRRLYEDFGMVSGDRLGVPVNLNRLSVGWYVNHAGRPNLDVDDDGRFVTRRRIRTGEELTADYRTFADEPLPFRPRPARPAPRV